MPLSVYLKILNLEGKYIPFDMIGPWYHYKCQESRWIIVENWV